MDVKGKYFQKINETKISDPSWSTKHLNSLKHNYSKAKCFKEVIDFIEDLYLTVPQTTISEVNFHFLSKICGFLGINTKLSFSSEYKLLEEGKTERLVDLCRQLKATDYFSGAAAQGYMDETNFEKENINVHYYDCSGYIEYEQLYGDFEHGVSVLDLMFNEGKNAKNFLKLNA